MKKRKNIKPKFEIPAEFMEKMKILADKLEIDSFIVSAPECIEKVKFKNKIDMAKQQSRFTNEAQETQMSKGFYSFEVGVPVVFTDLQRAEIQQDGKTKVIYKAIEEESGDLWTFPTHIKLSLKLFFLLETFSGQNNAFEVCLTGSEPVPNDPKKKNYLYRVKF